MKTFSSPSATWIITGGAGFIGSNFVRLALAESEARIVVLDKLTYAGHLESLADVAKNPRFQFVRGDIADRELVRALIADCRPSAVLNFAAESHVDRSIDDPASFIETNIRGTFELLNECREAISAGHLEDTGSFRFLHVSTDEVFGSLGPTGAFTETTRYSPRSPYSASKAAADHLAQAYFHTFGLPVLLTNCSNNYGPYQYPEKLIPLMILNAAQGRDLPIYGNGTNVRDWLHVQDHAEALLEVLRRGVPGQSYNVGGRQERSNLDIVDEICRVVEQLLPARDNAHLQRRGMKHYFELKKFVGDRPGHDQRYAIDPKKIESELGWTPRYQLEDGLRETVRWYLDNDDWCRRVCSEETRQRRGAS